MTFALPLLLAAMLGAPAPGGALLYATYCASCHGAQAFGTADGPSLRNAGLAVVDFSLMTGRMPAAAPWVEVAHRDARSGQGLPLDEIRALETYLAPIVAGGPPLPVVAAGGNLAHGRAIYELDCQQCHALRGVGGSIGGSDWAPSLERATINDVADAIRAGPEQMPRFGPHQLTQSDLDDVASYVMQMEAANLTVAPPPYASTGPIPEGAAGYVAIIVLVVFVFAFWRTDTPPRQREEAVRHDETERRP
jgi:ubiquinol-cytochrome c reductase cytochrome c subunit